MPKRVKHKDEADPNSWARRVVDETTGGNEVFIPQISPSALSAYMSALGRKGGRISGKNRKKNIPEQQRREIASRAARKRWENEAKRKAGKKR